MSTPVNPYIAGNPVTGEEMFFGREFYRCLCVGPTAGQVDTAVSHARNQLCIHFPNERAVATPVLFLRAPDGVIFDLL